MLLGLQTRISAYAVYQIPFGKGKQFGNDTPAAVNAVAGNWSINPIVSLALLDSRCLCMVQMIREPDPQRHVQIAWAR